MSRALGLVAVVLVAAVSAVLLFLLRSRPVGGVEPVTIVRATEAVDGRAVATLSGSHAPEEASPEPEPIELEPEPEPERPATEPSAEPASVAPTTSAAPTGRLTGRVLYDGKAPTLEPLDIPPGFQEGCCALGEAVDTTDRSLLVDDTNGLVNVVVTIRVAGREAPPPLEPIRIELAGCRFEPHVSVIPAGTTVGFVNTDRTSHNLHTYAGRRNDSVNRTLAPGAEHEQTPATADHIEIKCDIHPWMQAWLVVADTPYFAITDRRGRFEIEDLPVGEHKVELWHERLGKRVSVATVSTADEPEAIEIRMGPKLR